MSKKKSTGVLVGDTYWNVSLIKSRLVTDDNLLCRGLLRIYEFQTADEQDQQATKFVNGVGFNGADAEILSSFAQQLLKGRTLSPKQLEIARKKMPKYAQQLLLITEQLQLAKAAASTVTETPQ